MKKTGWNGTEWNATERSTAQCKQFCMKEDDSKSKSERRPNPTFTSNRGSRQTIRYGCEHDKIIKLIRKFQFSSQLYIYLILYTWNDVDADDNTKMLKPKQYRPYIHKYTNTPSTKKKEKRILWISMYFDLPTATERIHMQIICTRRKIFTWDDFQCSKIDEAINISVQFSFSFLLFSLPQSLKGKRRKNHHQTNFLIIFLEFTYINVNDHFSVGISPQKNVIKEPNVRSIQ